MTMMGTKNDTYGWLVPPDNTGHAAVHPSVAGRPSTPVLPDLHISSYEHHQHIHTATMGDFWRPLYWSN